MIKWIQYMNANQEDFDGMMYVMWQKCCSEKENCGNELNNGIESILLKVGTKQSCKKIARTCRVTTEPED